MRPKDEDQTTEYKELQYEQEQRQEIMRTHSEHEINNRTSDYVCVPCGAGYIEKGKVEEKLMGTTFHESKCGLCGKIKGVCHIRNFNYLRLPEEHEEDNHPSDIF